ncbi:MAG: ATP-binding protein [Cytophagaceae bacterium]
MFRFIKDILSPGGTIKQYLIWVSAILIIQTIASTVPSVTFYQPFNLTHVVFLTAIFISIIVHILKKDKHRVLAAYCLYVVGLIVSTITISQGITSLSGIIFMLTWSMTLFVAERREYISFDLVTLFMVLMLICTVILLMYNPTFDIAKNYYILVAGAVLTSVNIYLVYADFGAERNYYQKYRDVYYNLEILSTKMSEILSSDGELDQLLGKVSLQCIPLLGLEGCVIYFYNEAENQLSPVSVSGNKRLAAHENIVLNSSKNEGKTVEDCFVSAKPVLNDGGTGNYKSELAVPIISNGKVVGVIHSEHAYRGFFKDRHLQSFIIIASFCGIKITEYKSREAIEAARIAKEDADRYKVLDEMKHRFIANISHDLKTPLSLIKGPAIQISSMAVDTQVKLLSNLIVKNADHLLRVVNQLLQLNRVDEGLNHLYLEDVNTNALLTKIKGQYVGLAQEKKINFETNFDNVVIVTDVFRLEQIVHNVLHNAFRYTQTGGHIKLNARQDAKNFVIKIEDNGDGIPPEVQDKIFDRFFKVDENNQEGTGIGLSLVKEYTNSLGGEVNMESCPGEGTVFTIRIPNKPVKDTAQEGNIGFMPDNMVEVSAIKPVMLVVEDHADLNNFICSCFENEYQCIAAFDGEEALKKIRQDLPDIIITDLMMPKMNGIELVKNVKADEKTFHIPIIVLSAKDQLASKVSLYDEGVENYLTKPFDIQELRAIIDNVLEKRRKLMDVFFSNLKPQQDEHKELPKLVQATMDFILNHLDNPALNVSLLSDELGVGRNRLQRELKLAVGISPVEFIRSIRLNEAKKMLCSFKYSISEVAYKVGFNNLSYFSRSFKTEFGMLPSEWQEQSDLMNLPS